MMKAWQRVDPIDGYERTYRRGSYRVAYRSVNPGADYVLRDLYTDGSSQPIPLPAVSVRDTALTDEFFVQDLMSVEWFIFPRGETDD